jgi:hypothetical protein
MIVGLVYAFSSLRRSSRWKSLGAPASRCVLGTCNLPNRHASIAFSQWMLGETRPKSADNLRTCEEPTAIMDTVFEMDLAKTLEVSGRLAHALEILAKARRDLENCRSTGKLVFSIGG